MVTAADGRYLIDPYEVTAEDYRAWLSTHPRTTTQPALCAWNDSFEPGVLGPASQALVQAEGLTIDPFCENWLTKQAATGNLEVPVVCVDFCDAVAYCQWAKGHLCAQIGGGSLSFTSNPLPARGEWWSACSAGGSRAYPYGATYQKGACSDGNSRAQPAGSFPGCTSDSRVFDMSGNVSEWDDTCSTFDNPPEAETCLVRGGAFFNEGSDLTCTSHRLMPRAVSDTGTGFRCCGR